MIKKSIKAQTILIYDCAFIREPHVAKPHVNKKSKYQLKVAMEISVPTFEISLSFEIGELDYCVSWTKNETTIEHVEEVDDTELEQKDFDTSETNNVEAKITEKFVLKLSGGERSVKMSSVIEGFFKEESTAMSSG